MKLNDYTDEADLTEYAELGRTSVYLPALQSNYVSAALRRNPRLNFLRNDDKRYFCWPQALFSYGVAHGIRTPNMVTERDPDSYVLGDSGGFQIAKASGVFADYDPANRDDCEQRMDDLLRWYRRMGVDEGTILDVPPFAVTNKDQPRISTWQECLDGTLENADYMRANANGFPLLNVIQADNHDDAKTDAWFDVVTPLHMQGWAIACSPGGPRKRTVLRVILKLHAAGLLDPPMDRVHVLKCGDPAWAVVLDAVNRKFPGLRITMDNSTPSSSLAHHAYQREPDPFKRVWGAEARIPYVDKGEPKTLQDWRAICANLDERSPVLLYGNSYNHYIGHSTWARVLGTHGIARLYRLPARAGQVRNSHGVRYTKRVQAVLDAVDPLQELDKPLPAIGGGRATSVRILGSMRTQWT